MSLRTMATPAWMKPSRVCSARAASRVGANDGFMGGFARLIEHRPPFLKNELALG